MNSLSKVLMSAALCFAATASSAQTTLGYSNGNVERKHGVRLTSNAQQGMAIRITKEKAQALKGKKIIALESAFSTRNINNLEFFIAHQLDGKAITRQTTTDQSTRWKEFPLDRPFVIDGEEFFIGYTCSVDEAYKPLLFDESKDFGNELMWGFYADASGKGEWKDISNMGLGAANLRFIVEEDVPGVDAMIKPADTKGYYKINQAYAFNSQVFNFGTETINSFDITYQISDDEPQVYHVEDAFIESGSTYDFQLPEYLTTKSGKLPFSLTISNINGSDKDNTVADNQAISSAYIYPADVERKVLIETFTGQDCGNCPSGHKTMSEALKGIEDNFVEVAHHSGYQPDVFTMKDDGEYVWFYANPQTYAPAAMLNRNVPYEGAESVVFQSNEAPNVKAAIERYKDAQPYVSVKLDNQYDAATKKCVITVEVFTHMVPSLEEHRLNLFLTQDGIKHRQAGAADYVHNHVFRGSLNGAWGEPIKLVQGETVKKTYEYTLPDFIISDVMKKKIATVPENMNFVAFVSDVTTSPLTSVVYNTAAVNLVHGNTTGIDDVQAESAAQISVEGKVLSLDGRQAVAAVYNMAGQHIANLKAGESVTLSQGIYAVKVISNGKVSSKKIMIAE